MVKSTKINITEYQEGMPCHRYLLRNLKTEVDALSFVKTFVNTMTHVGMKDSQIEACIYLFSTHLPPDSSLKGFSFEKWPNMMAGVSLVDCIRMDSSVATFKKCTQFYKKQSPKTEACKICPLYHKYCNNKKEIETLILRYVLESKENFDYVRSMGITSVHFHSLVDVLEHVTTALVPGIYSFYSDLFKALSYEYIAEAHFGSDDKTIPCSEIDKFISTKLLNGSIPTSFISSPTFINRVIIVLWDSIMENPLKTKEEIHTLVCSLLSNDDSLESVLNTTVADSSDLGKDAINDYYETSVVNSGKDKNAPSAIYEHISISSVLSGTLASDEKKAEVEVDMFSSFASFMELDENGNYTTGNVANDTSGASSTTEPVLKAEMSEQVNMFDLPAEENLWGSYAAFDIVSDTEGNATAEENESIERRSFIPEEIHETIFHTTESGEIELRELPMPDYDKEYYEEEGSMVSLPTVSFNELSHFAICLDKAESRLLTIFESHLLKDRQLCIELVRTHKGLRYFLIYSPRLHAYFYTNMSDRRVYEILKSILSYPSIEKYCYYPFSLAAALMKFDIYPKSFLSLFCLTCIKMPGHTLTMEQALEMLGARKAIGGITIKPEGDILSLPILYMHAYPNVYKRVTNSLKSEGCYAEYLERNQFDLILSRFYYQDLYETENRSLLAVKNASRYTFSDAVHREYRERGNCYTYRFSRCYTPNRLLRKVILAMDNKGYFKKYHIMITALSAISFTLFIANEDNERVRTLIHIALLEILMDEEYKNVEYELIEVKA